MFYGESVFTRAFRTWGRVVYEDGPLVDRPADDQAVAVGAVAEGVGLMCTPFEVFPRVGDQFLDVLLARLYAIQAA